MANASFTDRRNAAFFKVHMLTTGLPEYWGTGYPVEKPHALVIDRHFTIDVTLFPEGNNGLIGIGKGRPHTYHTVEV